MNRSFRHAVALSLMLIGFAHAGTATPPEPLSIGHSVSLQLGLGPQDAALGADPEPFYGLRYEPTLAWSWPNPQWPRWQAFVRTWLNYTSSQTSLPFQEQQRREVEHGNAELREFYLRRPLLGDDPRFALTLGRQRFADPYGLWWDDSLEALRLDYRATFSSGFLAIGERLSYYNSDGSSLEAGERDILYGMAEFAWRWHRNHWAGLRALHEDDHSGRAARLGANGRPEDDSDFQGWRFGLFSHGNLIDAPVSDYRLEAQYLDGTLLSLPPAGAGAGAAPIAMKSTRSGWAVVAELGRRLPSLPWSPRLSLRSGLTDAPETANNGFYFNRLQSGRVSGQDSYSSGLLGSFVRIELHNVMFHGLAVETQPRPQHRFDLRLSTLSLRNSGAMNGQRTALPLSVSRDVRLDKARGRTLGQVLDLTYHWELFPVAVNGRHLNLDVQLNAGYFHAGDALGDLDDDYQLSFSAAAHY